MKRITIEERMAMPRIVAAVPPDKWPLWARALKSLATSEDSGIGDVVARTIGEENSETFKAWFEKTFNRPCGCNGRQAEWNQKFPLPTDPLPPL